MKKLKMTFVDCAQKKAGAGSKTVASTETDEKSEFLERKNSEASRILAANSPQIQRFFTDCSFDYWAIACYNAQRIRCLSALLAAGAPQIAERGGRADPATTSN